MCILKDKYKDRNVWTMCELDEKEEGRTSRLRVTHWVHSVRPPDSVPTLPRKAAHAHLLPSAPPILFEIIDAYEAALPVCDLATNTKKLEPIKWKEKVFTLPKYLHENTG